MADQALVAGIDIGTTGTRCVVFDLEGRRVGGAHVDYPTISSADGRVEQSVPVILDATWSVCARAVADSRATGEVVAVGMSAQMSNTCPVSDTGEILRPLVSWEDTRAVDQVDWITQRIAAEDYKATTGVAIGPGLVLPTMLWVREHEPDVFARASAWPQLQGLALRALGADGFPLDECEAFAYGLWDVADRRWSVDLLALAGIDVSALPTPVRAGTPVATLSTAAAERTGFPEGTTVCVGAGDQMCGMVGMGAIDGRIATSTIGTGGAIEATLSRPRTDLDGITTVNHAVGGRWAAFAPTLSAASSYRWLKDQLWDPETASNRNAGKSDYAALDDLAATSPVGSHGLVFLPYLNTAGAPRWNPAASGAFLGLTQDTTRADLARAVLEGVTLELRDSLDVLVDGGLDPEVIRLGGGAARSDLWTRIQADVFGRPVQRLQEREVAALGAAVLAATGSGLFTSLEEATAAMVHVAETVDPDPRGQAHYSALHDVFDVAYDALDRSVFGLLRAGRDATGSPPADPGSPGSAS